MTGPVPAPTAPFASFEESWQPRTEAWLGKDASLFAGRAGRPLFIGACPRSGTTLLRSMLHNHPDLAIPPETDFVVPLFQFRVRFGNLRDRENRRAVGRWLFEEAGHGGRRLRAGRFSEEEAIARVVASEPTMGSIIDTCFSLYAEAHDKPRWGDKRPGYAAWLDAIYALFPDAQFLNVVRDPRASVASQIALDFHEEFPLATAVAVWETAIHRVDTYADRLRPDQLLDIRYEDLVRDPESELRRVCVFAGLRADPECLDTMIHGERRANFSKGWHDRVAEPVSTASVERWRETLTPPQIALVEQETRAQYGRLGYQESGISGTPDPAELAQLAYARRRRRRKWRRRAWDERRRRLLLYRRPVAAERSAPPT